MVTGRGFTAQPVLEFASREIDWENRERTSAQIQTRFRGLQDQRARLRAPCSLTPVLEFR